jgi:DNA-binding GntR family transcriptional regulator
MVRGAWSPSFVIMSTIDREGPIPPYRQIADELRGEIADGTIPVGRRIPTLVELEARYEVARDTLRKAVKVLKDEGLVETVTGMGVYVVKQPADEA